MSPRGHLVVGGLFLALGAVYLGTVAWEDDSPWRWVVGIAYLLLALGYFRLARKFHRERHSWSAED